jgi:hypothetical protein
MSNQLLFINSKNFIKEDDMEKKIIPGSIIAAAALVAILNFSNMPAQTEAEMTTSQVSVEETRA